MWTEPTQVAGASTVLSALRSEANLALERLPEGVRPLFESHVSAKHVAHCWRFILDTDRDRSTRDPIVRNLLLVAVFHAFEQLRLRNYRELQAALADTATGTGRPMSVLGTRCELASRTAEGLYTEARRAPGAVSSTVILPFVDQLLTAALNDCKQRDNPNYAKRWLGIRGVCRLMIAVQSPVASLPLQHKRFRDSADDLERAFRLGNRGSSAAAFLLDALLHVLDVNDTPETLARLHTAVSSLSELEKQSRSVQLFTGMYLFARSFREPGPAGSLRQALQCLDSALKLPVDLSADDGFINLIRGQVLIRISMSEPDPTTNAAIESLDNGIASLKRAFESGPDRFAKQTSLQSALYSRARGRLRAGRYAEAKEDIGYVLSRPLLCVSDERLTAQLEFMDILADLRSAHDSEDLSALETALSRALDHTECSSHGAIAIGLAAKQLFWGRDSGADPSLLVRTLDVLEAADLPEDPISRRMQLSIRARLSLMHGLSWSPVALEKAVELSLAAIEAHSESPEPELLGLAGETALQLARRLLSEDESQAVAADYLEQAADHFDKAIAAVEGGRHSANPGFQLVVSYSKAGEAYLRLCRLIPATEFAERSIERFESAYALGNRTPEMVGLLGDAYYSHFRLTRRPDMLDRALDKKSESRDAGSAARENLSLSAKLSFLRWERTAELDDLKKAIALCVQAHDAAPAWPWPAFQLAEMLEQAGVTLPPEESPESRGLSSARLLALMAEGREALLRYGCELVIADKEFEKRTLGGRQPVYVLDDPHRLLSSSYVFKHTEAQSAERDRATVESFARFLREKEISGLSLPAPVAIVPYLRTDQAVYVMRRAPGFHLGRLAVRALSAGHEVPFTQFERALGFLAAFHAWGDTVSPPSKTSAVTFVKDYLKKTLGVPSSTLPQTTREALGLVGPLPEAIKKDAHPENWLIDERGRLSMLDFESVKRLPVPFEVVQLLDDYPVLPVTDEGWLRRMSATRHYLTTRTELSGTPTIVSDDVLSLLYGACLVLRARFGTRQVTRPNRTRGSSSSLRALAARRQHYLDVLEWLKRRHPFPAVRDLSVALADLPM